ncbi:polysaccharide biosynthesis/export family protein [Hymenobacter norwichensis]|uniref:polysaccharide biosynthesis/export family protein n=1 Tax=Hymenobacter norwichensis TaxID=223903 RepID=UPI000525C9B8|nr:polysaccharide biosynthesis/export family protein [Hymenobacter norwichensis]
MRQSAFYSISRLLSLCVPILLLLSACGTTRVYNQRTMFRLSDGKGLDTMKLRGVVNRVNRNYIIQPNDLLAVRVYTNNGERIIDPNGELQFGAPAGMLPTGTNGSRTLATNAGQAASPSGDSEFTVQTDGTVRLPLINQIKITGYTLLQADSVLKVRYEEFYKGVFVVTRVTNSRVVVLGSPGGKIIPLVNDNMNLIEVLAAAGGIDGGGSGNNAGGGSLYRSGGRASNIRIIRGDLKNPQVEQVDLTTINGMRRANLQVEPNDIIYVEPVRRPVSDALVDASPVITLFSAVVGTLLAIVSISRTL